jgi:hypothetical protein
METLAYMHLSMAHEEADLDPGVYDLKLFNGFNWKPPSSAWIRLLSAIMAVSILSLANSSFAYTSRLVLVNTRVSPLMIRNEQGKVIGSLEKGTYVRIVADPDRDREFRGILYYPLTRDRGYVAAKYLKPEPLFTSDQATGSGSTGMTVAEAIELGLDP